MSDDLNLSSCFYHCSPEYLETRTGFGEVVCDRVDDLGLGSVRLVLKDARGQEFCSVRLTPLDVRRLALFVEEG